MYVVGLYLVLIDVIKLNLMFGLVKIEQSIAKWCEIIFLQFHHLPPYPNDEIKSEILKKREKVIERI